MTLLGDWLESRIDAIMACYEASVRDTLVSPSMSREDVLDDLREFIVQLAHTLRTQAVDASGKAAGTSRLHGRQRLHLGFDVASVVRDYTVLLDCILGAAAEDGRRLELDEMRTIVRLIGAMSSEAVETYQRMRDRSQRQRAAEHLGFLAHELRNPLNSARLALEVLRVNGLPPSRQADVMDRSLRTTVGLIDDALIAMRSESAESTQYAPLGVAALLREIADESGVDAESKGSALVVEADEALQVDADQRLMRAVLTNLVRNAVKFSHAGATIAIRGRLVEARVVIEVEDECGGLAPEQIERVFDTHAQVGTDRSGFGLGLAIAKQAAEAHHGTLAVQNLPGKGCVFRLDVPQVQAQR